VRSFFETTKEGDMQSDQNGQFRVHGVRYQTHDVDRAVAFYTKELGCELKHQQGTAFAAVSFGTLDVLLSGPGSSGARPLPDGPQQPGGWNRLVLAVKDLAAVVATLRDHGVHFRSDIVSGPGGKQVQLLDPDENPIELFEPAPRA
jgi:glyoxylase I family protein